MRGDQERIARLEEQVTALLAAGRPKSAGPITTREFDSGFSPGHPFGSTCASVAEGMRRVADSFDSEIFHPQDVVVTYIAKDDRFHTVELRITYSEYFK